MSAKKPEDATFGRRSFFFRLGKGAKRKAAAVAAGPGNEEIQVSASELTEHRKDELRAFLARLAAKKESPR